MSKLLRNVLELYRPKAKDEQKFVDKHVIKKHKLDKPSEDDALFQATNIKPVKRATEHGYEPGQDEKVYEGRKYGVVFSDALNDRKKSTSLTPKQQAEKEKIVTGMKDKYADFQKRYGDRAKEVMYATATKMAKEEVEHIEEVSSKTLKSYKEKSGKDLDDMVAKGKEEGMSVGAHNKFLKRLKGNNRAAAKLIGKGCNESIEEELDGLTEERSLTMAHVKKRLKMGHWKPLGPIRPGKYINVQDKQGKTKTVLIRNEQIELMACVFDELDEENKELFFTFMDEDFDGLLEFVNQFELAE